MFAIFKTGGKQYKVDKGSVIKVEKLDGKVGTKLKFDEVLLLGEASKAFFVGNPTIKGAAVTAEITEQLKDTKVLVFKKKRRQNYRRMAGHRQELTEIKIVDIVKE